MYSAKKIITELLQLAGITINGKQVWDIQVHNELFYARSLQDHDLGFGESYMEGWWDCPRLDIAMQRLVDANIENKLKFNQRLLLQAVLTKIFNFQTKKRALAVAEKHYDLGNALFQAMLDDRMNYTCGYWKNANSLNQAQTAKLDLACRKLLLKPGMRVLDIGCGWGAFAKYAAENYGVSVIGVTISQQQFQLAKERCAGLPVEIRFQDYRDLNEEFDRIISLGMFEHVGYHNYRTYLQVVNRCLTDQGIFLLHTIGGNISTTKASAWITKYIFPNGMLPSVAQIGKASEGLFVMEDWHNFGTDYDKTLMAWHHNFNQHWPELKAHYDERFFRMWNFYLLTCAGSFRARDMQLWQIVFSKRGIAGGYDAPR
jgi:cyclopropane-fatty-acyl-phospholipid synthase